MLNTILLEFYKKFGSAPAADFLLSNTSFSSPFFRMLEEKKPIFWPIERSENFKGDGEIGTEDSFSFLAAMTAVTVAALLIRTPISPFEPHLN